MGKRGRGRPRLDDPSIVESKELLESYLELGTYKKVSDKYHIDPGVICRRLQVYQKNNPDEYHETKMTYYRDKEESMINKGLKIEDKLLDKIDEEINNEENNYNITQLATTYGIIYDKRRTTAGQSNTNVATAIEIKLPEGLQELAK